MNSEGTGATFRRRLTWALLISTPKGKGYFYDLYRMGQNAEHPDYQSWNLPSWKGPEGHAGQQVSLVDGQGMPLTMEAVKRRLLLCALRYAGGRVKGKGGVADLLGVSHVTVLKWLKISDIDPNDFR